jgi:lipid A 4'-phosphatase
MIKMKPDTRNILAHAAALFILTIPFWALNLDLRVQRIFYDFQGAKWFLKDNPVVVFLYNYGVYPGLALTAAAAAVFGFGFTYKKLVKYRKPAILIVLTMLLGPAIAVNVVLKDYSGRPRPREIKEFSGKMAYRHVFEFGTPGKGYSFPCGHCSTGFLFTALYFAYRKKNKLLANSALWGGVALGTLIGAGRMAQGAHFLSDVLWAGGITVITAEIIYYKILGGEGQGLFDRVKAGVPGRAGSYAAAAGLLAVLAVAALIATPYAGEKSFSTDINARDIVNLKLDVEGDVNISQAPAKGLIHIQAAGFGFPRRSFDGELKQTRENGVTQLEFKTIKKGFFSELNAAIDVSLPPAKEYRITVNDKKGDIECSLTGDSPEIALTAQEGDIDLKAGKLVKNVLIVTKRGNAGVVFNKETMPAKRAFVDIKAQGTLEITNRSAYFIELKTGSEKINGARELYYKSRSKDGPEMSVKAGKIVIK